MNVITAKAYAKINWALDILATRENGYHELDMLMQSVSLHDTLTFSAAGDICLMTDGKPDPYGEKNLIVRAARLLQKETGCTQGALIELTKRTPAMAGLGGGSADCAAAFIALKQMWKLDIGDERLFELGFSLGADVPFCLMGGLARVGGLGERLSWLEAPETPHMLLIMPDDGLSTSTVFGEYDRYMRLESPVEMEEAERALLSGDYRVLDRFAQNVLTEPAMRVTSSVGQAIARLKEYGAVFARMSGSGSAVFGVFESAAEAETARRELCGDYPFCECIQTVPAGVELAEEI